MSTALRARQLVVSGEREAAAELVRGMVSSLLDADVQRVLIGNDEYSLNSVFGRAVLADGDVVFFKFHVEESESDGVGEYYRATVLADHGLPIDVPIATSNDPGEQMVVYAVRESRRMSDVCLDLERDQGPNARLTPELRSARERLDDEIGRVLVATVRTPGDPNRPAAGLHQLFTHRMVDPSSGFPGGRYRGWYIENHDWPWLGEARWTLHGVTYDRTLADLAESAFERLKPDRFATEPVVVGHGDDHHGNVWVVEGNGPTELRLFDPAFAGDDLPALLALVKPTFHNVFAHPFWLYHPELVEPGTVDVRIDESRRSISVTVDDRPQGGLSALREQVLTSIVDRAWIPLLAELRRQGLLDPHWREVVRSALFLCPFLVTDLLAAHRTPQVRMLGLANAVMMGSEPVTGDDPVTRMFDRIEGALG